VFIVDVPEFEPIWQRACAEAGDVELHRVGHYIELRFPESIVIDRAATGARHAVWYSCVGALRNARVVQFDKDALRITAT
jgi:hypothetical protein